MRLVDFTSEERILLLRGVLRWLPREEWFTYAHVSRLFRDAVLDEVWHSVDDVYNLFRILGPIAYFEGAEKKMVFYSHLGPEDWDNAQSNFDRVKELLYDERTCKDLSDDVWSEVALSRDLNKPSYLPNLRKLTWLVHGVNALRPMIQFLHCPILELTVRMPSIMSPDQWAICEDIADRSPQLTSLDIRVDVVEPESIDAIVNLIGSLQRLESVSFPPSHLTAGMLHALGSLLHLQYLRSVSRFPTEDDDDDSHMSTRGEDLSEERLTLLPSAFLRLRSLAIQLSLDSMQRLLVSGTSFNLVKTLEVETWDLEDEVAIRSFARAVHESMPRLQHLTLDIRDRFLPVEERRTDIKAGVGFPAFESFLLLPLQIFRVVGDIQPDFTDDDVMKMAGAWPSLQKLYLNPGFLIANDLPLAKISLKSLEVLAQRCHCIQELGLYMNTSDVAEMKIARVPFRKLRQLAVGFSEVSDPFTLSTFLAELFSGISVIPAVIPGAEWFKEDEAKKEEDVDSKSPDAFLSDRRRTWRHISDTLIPAVFYAAKRWYGDSFADRLKKHCT